MIKTAADMKQFYIIDGDRIEKFDFEEQAIIWGWRFMPRAFDIYRISDDELVYTSDNTHATE